MFDQKNGQKKKLSKLKKIISIKNGKCNVLIIMLKRGYIMDYSELLKKRRSIRNFEDKKVPLEIIQEMLHEACLAPSACNTQPWRFIIIQDQQLIKRISDESKRCGLAIIEKHPDSIYSKFAESFNNPNYNIFYNAPALIFVVCEKDNPIFNIDCANAANYLMFAATNKGLGTCWIGLAHPLEYSELKKEIGISENYQIAAVLALGYPESIPEPAPRNDLIIVNSIGFP
ncbi:MAG: nitroreductase family protein [Gammaproteobacteria bacterium]